MRILLTTLLASIIVSFPFAQDSDTEVRRFVYADPFNTANQNYIRLFNKTDEMREADVLRFEDWQALKVLDEAGTEYAVDSANYHIVADQILFKRDGQILSLDPELVEYAFLGQVPFIRLRLKDKKKVSRSKTYFEVLEEGEYLLLRKTNLKERTTNDHPMGLAATREVTFEQAAEFYYTSSPKASTAIPLPKKKSDLIRIFKSNRNEIIEYAQNNKLSTKKEWDLIKLFNYYNQLQL